MTASCITMTSLMMIPAQNSRVYKGIPESEFSSDADHAGYRLPELELFEEDMIKIGVIA